MMRGAVMSDDYGHYNKTVADFDIRFSQFRARKPTSRSWRKGCRSRFAERMSQMASLS